MDLGNVDAMLPKVVEVQDLKTEKASGFYSDEERLEKLNSSIENLRSAIKTNEESINKAQKAIDEHGKSIDKLNTKIGKIKNKSFSKNKVSKLEKNIEIHRKIIANLERVILDLKTQNEKFNYSIKNINSIIEYLK